jgi:hypothetical protein
MNAGRETSGIKEVVARVGLSREGDQGNRAAVVAARPDRRVEDRIPEDPRVEIVRR